MSSPKRVTRPIRENPQATTVVVTGLIAAVVGAFADKYAPGVDAEARALVVGGVSVPALAIIGWLAQRFTLPAAAVNLTPEQVAAGFAAMRARERGGERPSAQLRQPSAENERIRLHLHAPPTEWSGPQPAVVDPWMEAVRPQPGEPEGYPPPPPEPVAAPTALYDGAADNAPPSPPAGTSVVHAPTAAEAAAEGTTP